MSEQMEILPMSKEEATKLLIENEMERIRLQGIIEGLQADAKDYRDKLKPIIVNIDQLSILANRK